jgi:hypothetical protein
MIVKRQSLPYTVHQGPRGGLEVYDIYDMIYKYLTAVGLTPGGSSTSQIYTQTVHVIQRKENNRETGKL